MRYTGPKARLCRREGVNLFGNEKYTKIMRNSGSRPGMHGERYAKLSEYGRQLREKQKARSIFGISEKQFHNYYKKAVRQPGQSGENLLRLLELRLDNVMYVSQFAVTRLQARQQVGHGHFLLNGRRVDIPSIQVQAGDKIQVRPKLKTSPLYQGFEKLKDYSPKWMKVDLKNLMIEITDIPQADELEKSVDSKLIVEFYSR
ncbi:30S ribosomal protein S4 [Candidatus Peregrinibacteria bacterium]|nr:30S ribosomal protein S4 [Candidatus Peregrinibacteria bacterium]